VVFDLACVLRGLRWVVGSAVWRDLLVWDLTAAGLIGPIVFKITIRKIIVRLGVRVLVGRETLIDVRHLSFCKPI
jgi:hypothetical protein